MRGSLSRGDVVMLEEEEECAGMTLTEDIRTVALPYLKTWG